MPPSLREDRNVVGSVSKSEKTLQLPLTVWPLVGLRGRPLSKNAGP